MSRQFDVIVVGVGAMGSAACYELARRGASVLGLDRFDIPNTLAAHHGHSRVIRLAYYEHADYVPLLRRSHDGWEEVSSMSGTKLIYRTGGLYIGRLDGDFVAGSIRSAQEHGLPHEVLSHEQLIDRYPQFRAPTYWTGMYEPEAGLVVPERAVEAYASQARRRGAELHANEPVLEVARGLRVRTDREEYRANHVVFASGAWTGLHGQPPPGVELVTTRQVLGWVKPKRPELFTADRFPVFAINNPDQSAHYGFPIIDGVPGPPGGFKIAHHWHDRVTDPDTINREPEPGDEADFRDTLTRFLPDADGDLLEIKICMYTNSPDCHFVVDAHPAFDRGDATLACGFSGHGFKFAPAIGRAVADLALDGKTDLPIGFLGLDRFATS